MTGLTLISADDVISSHDKKKNIEKDFGRIVVKRKKEKPIRVLRVRHYGKTIFQSMDGCKIVNKDAFAVNRGLESLLKELCHNTNINGYVVPDGCILVEKDDRMGVGNKFIFIEISREEFPILKRQLENHTTTCAFNMGEFSILEGGMSYLNETWDMPRIWKADNNKNNKISDSNKIVAMEKLRCELKDRFRPYHSKSDEDIDNMSDRELLEIKKLANEKMKIENRKRRMIEGFLR